VEKTVDDAAVVATDADAAADDDADAATDATSPAGECYTDNTPEESEAEERSFPPGWTGDTRHRRNCNRRKEWEDSSPAAAVPKEADAARCRNSNRTNCGSIRKKEDTLPSHREEEAAAVPHTDDATAAMDDAGVVAPNVEAAETAAEAAVAPRSPTRWNRIYSESTPEPPPPPSRPKPTSSPIPRATPIP